MLSYILSCAIAFVEFHAEGEIVLFGVILFSCSVTRTSAFLLRAVNCWLALIVCDVALVPCASSLVQKSLFGWHRSCCFIHRMSLDSSVRTWRISLIKPSLGHINMISSWNKFIAAIHAPTTFGTVFYTLCYYFWGQHCCLTETNILVKNFVVFL